MSESIDVAGLVHDIQSTADEIVVLKRALRRRWEVPMGDAQRALCRLKKRATELCILRAWTRGRLHLKDRPREGLAPLETWDRDAYHARIAERLRAAYLRAAE